MSRHVTRWLTTVLLAILAMLAACGSTGAGSDVPFSPDDIVADVATDDTAPDAPREPTKVDEAFRVVFPYVQYSPATAIKVDWMNPATREADPATSFDALLAAENPALTCQLGCIPDASGRWLAVVVAEPTSATSGSTVRIFRLFEGPTLAASGIPDVVDVRTFAFGTDAFVFTRFQYGCYESDVHLKACARFFRIDLSTQNPAGEESMFTFPTEANLDSALPPSGKFRIGQDGRTIIVLGTKVESQSVWLWRGPTGLPLQVTEPICAGIAPGGGCLGSATSFSDADPVALSPDGNHLVLALIENDHALVLVHVDLREGAGTRKTAALLAMPDDQISFGDNACYNRQAWQPTFVHSPLRFSPDGSEVIFVAGTDCLPNRARSWTNVVAIPLAMIDAEGAIAHDGLRWITDFPHGDTLTACVSILPDSMDLSPAGDYIVFAGSPMLDSSLQLIPDGQDQLRNDAEVWVTRRDGTTQSVQLTAKQGWKVASTRAIAMPPPRP